MNLQKQSSGAAKAGLTTGIIGTSLGAVNLLAQHGVLGGLLGGSGCCSEDHTVNRYELGLIQTIAKQDSEIALRDANEYQQKQQLETYKYVDGRFRDIELQLAKQAVNNQATADSIQMVQERSQCCCDKLEMKLENECRERKCADNSIITYVNATFYPKQVADVTTGTTTTPQNTYNPLPVACCNPCNN